MKDYDVTDEFISEKNNQEAKKSRINLPELDSTERKIAGILIGIGLILALIFAFTAYSSAFTKIENITEISNEDYLNLQETLNTNYPDRSSILRKINGYENPSLNVWAGSAILIDAANGNILYEKNADALIPPASIAKLFVMYIVFKDAALGKFSLDDVVPVPEKSWAVNMPRDASLMFLGQGHVVTLRELLKGLAVASGNDAALAVANFVSGSTQAFVQRMNEECAALGLKNTRFVEPSGYDENNITTARELAAFCKIYISSYPESVQEFHSAPSIRYPLQKNLPDWQKDKGDSQAIYQKNTNPLLPLLRGCDGIKTGFIYESGYNLALTAMRDGVRFISITLRGTGVGSKQGNAGRVHDGTVMMEWGFKNFADFVPEDVLPQGFTVPSIGAKNHNGKFVRLVPAWTTPVSVRAEGEKTALEEAKSVKINVEMPRFIYGGVSAGQEYGKLQYVLNGRVIETVPLVADRTDEKAGVFGRLLGALVSWKL